MRLPSGWPWLPSEAPPSPLSVPPVEQAEGGGSHKQSKLTLRSCGTLGVVSWQGGVSLSK